MVIEFRFQKKERPKFLLSFETMNINANSYLFTVDILQIFLFFNPHPRLPSVVYPSLCRKQTA